MADRPADGRAELESIVSRYGRRFQTVGDMVRHVIREAILTGVFTPGEYLRQDRLAQDLGVSRIPIRSALLQLESEGLVTFHAFRGAAVTGLTADEMREIYEIRELLEAHGLRKAFDRMTPERLERLDELACALNDIDDGEAFLERRAGFYRELYDGERQPQLVALIEKLRNETGRYLMRQNVDFLQQPGHRDHQRLLEFVRGHDMEGALAWQRAHLGRVCAEAVARIEEAPANGG